MSDLPQFDFAMSPEQRALFERIHGKKKTSSKATPAPPGSGPAGEFCKGCRHFVRNAQWSKTYFKCGLIRATKGPGTDIRANLPSCSQWEKQA